MPKLLFQICVPQICSHFRRCLNQRFLLCHLRNRLQYVFYQAMQPDVLHIPFLQIILVPEITITILEYKNSNHLHIKFFHFSFFRFTFSPSRRSQIYTCSHAAAATNLPSWPSNFTKATLHRELAIIFALPAGIYFKYCLVKPIL